MSVLASLIGSGAGIIAIALAILVGRHYRHLPFMAHQWAERAVIILMFAGGSAISVTQLGQWADSAVRYAAGLLGGVGAGLPYAALVVTSMFLLAAVIVSLVFAPSQCAGLTAAALPAVMALAPGGFLHQAYLALTGPAQALAQALSSWIGG